VLNGRSRKERALIRNQQTKGRKQRFATASMQAVLVLS
jgi:hypothetical protein